jgi:hypothetical protein
VAHDVNSSFVRAFSCAAGDSQRRMVAANDDPLKHSTGLIVARFLGRKRGKYQAFDRPTDPASFSLPRSRATLM